MNATAQLINRRFTTQRGNLVTVFVTKQVRKVNGFAALGRITQVTAVVKGRTFDVGASFRANAVVTAAGF